MDSDYRRQYEINKLLGIPKHPPCDVCGKIDGGHMGGTRIGNYMVCGNKCFKRMEIRINNGLVPFNKDTVTAEKQMRDRIKCLKHQLKSHGIKPCKTKIGL